MRKGKCGNNEIKYFIDADIWQRSQTIWTRTRNGTQEWGWEEELNLQSVVTIQNNTIAKRETTK